MESHATWLVVSLASLAACGRVGFELAGDGATSDSKGGSTQEEILDGPLPDVTLAIGCVTWSPTVHGNAVGLQNAGFDALSAAGGIAVAADALTMTSGQRGYLEILVINSDDNAEIGIKDGSTTQLDEYHVDTSGSNVHYDNFEGELISKGNGWSTEVARNQPNFRDGDTIMWALDHSLGFIWYGRNGTWLGNGNPAIALNPTFQVPITSPWFPSVYADDGSRFQIRGSMSDQMYVAPVGFTSFAAAVGLGDGDCIPGPDPS